MRYTLSTCDRCGKILRSYNNYFITAFENDTEDGTYYYCKQCYFDMTDLLNKNVEKRYGDRTKRMQDFINEYNERFGEE